MFAFIVELVDLVTETVQAVYCKNEVELTNLLNNYDKIKYGIGQIGNLGKIQGVKETDITEFLKKEEGLETGEKKEEKTNA